jgi:hypothetical protein
MKNGITIFYFETITKMDAWLRIFTYEMLEEIISAKAAAIRDYTTLRQKFENGRHFPEIYKDKDGINRVRGYTLEFCERELFIAQRQHDDASNELKRRQVCDD